MQKIPLAIGIATCQPRLKPASTFYSFQGLKSHHFGCTVIFRLLGGERLPTRRVAANASTTGFTAALPMPVPAGWFHY